MKRSVFFTLLITAILPLRAQEKALWGKNRTQTYDQLITGG